MRKRILKYDILSQWLKEQIENGTYQENERIPSETELAERFGFSRQTVRQAIGQMETEGYLTRLQGSGTYVQIPIQQRKRTERIGVVTTYLDDYIFPSIIQGIEMQMSRSGYSFQLGITYNKTYNEKKVLEQMLNNDLDGIIIEGTKSALPNLNFSILEEFHRRQIPMVFINGYYQRFSESYVVMDDIKGSELLVDELLHNGHTRIGCILKSDDIQGHKRYEGVLLRLQEYGVPIMDCHILWYTTEDIPYYFGGKQDEYILERFQDVTAIICYNDQISTEVINLYQRNGISIPGKISIASFDNSPLAQNTVYNLTSVSYEGEEVGQKASQILLRKIENYRMAEKIKIEPILHIRQSITKFD